MSCVVPQPEASARSLVHVGSTMKLPHRASHCVVNRSSSQELNKNMVYIRIRIERVILFLTKRFLGRIDSHLQNFF